MPPHCDAMDGPVATAARRALDSGDVTLVLPFVSAAGDAELRQAFAQAVQARKAGPAAAQVADRWFFETAVRLHRAGEGQPYTGLKPAGLDVGPVVPLAEAALRDAQPVPLFKFLTNAMHEELHRRFDHAIRLRGHDPKDVEAARARTAAELSFIVWAHAVHQSFAKDPHAKSTPPPAHEH